MVNHAALILGKGAPHGVPGVGMKESQWVREAWDGGWHVGTGNVDRGSSHDQDRKKQFHSDAANHIGDTHGKADEDKTIRTQISEHRCQ